MTSPGVMREAHPMLSKSIQSIVGIFVGFAIGGVLGLIATPPAPAPSMPGSGFIAEVDRESGPVAVTLTTVLVPTTRGPRDDAVLSLPPVAPEATPADTSPTPKATKAKSTKPAVSTPTRNVAPKPKPKPPPAPRATPAPPPPAVEPPAPVVESPPPPPEPKAEKPKGAKPKPDKPPKPPKPPK